MSVMTTLLMLNSSFRHQHIDDLPNFASVLHDNGVTHLLWLIVPPVLLVMGCYGNVMTMVVMQGMRASESTACLSVYFTALAVSDLGLLCTLFYWYWPMIALNTPLTYFHDLACTVTSFVSYTSTMTSAWFLVAMTCQRLTSVILPHRVEVLCTVRRGKVITAIIVIISSMANIHFFFHYRVYISDDEYKNCGSLDEQAVNIFGFLDLCLSSLIPFLFLIVANAVLIYRTQQSLRMAGKMTVGDTRQTTSRSAKVSSMTITLILTSAAFLVLTLPTCILNIHLEMIGYYQGPIEDEQQRERLAFAYTACTLMWMGNSAINFYIYILSGSKFRQESKRHMMCLRFKHT